MNKLYLNNLQLQNNKYKRYKMHTHRTLQIFIQASNIVSYKYNT